MWKTSKLSQVGGKAFKFVNVKLQIKKLDASLSVLVEYGWICEKSASRNIFTDIHVQPGVH